MKRFLGVLIAGAALLSVAPGLDAGKATPGRDVKFLLQYHGTVQSNWRDTETVDTNECSGSDISGTFTSAVRSGTKPNTIVLGTDVDGSVGVVRVTQSPVGVVTSSRTDSGWTLDYSGGECTHVPYTNARCDRTLSFASWANMQARESQFGVRPHVYLAWTMESQTPDTSGCADLEWNARANPNGPIDGTAQLLDVKKLYHCGLRNPHGCKLTLSGSRSSSVDEPSGSSTHTGATRVEWSITFKAVD